MTVPIFRTRADSEEDVQIASVGFLGRGGKGGVRVDVAAQIMSELQEVDPDGRIILDENGNPKPLTGAKLTAAAKEYAEAHGLVVQNVADEKADRLREELGLPPDRPPAREVVLERAARSAALAEVENARTELALAGPVEAEEEDEE